MAAWRLTGWATAVIASSVVTAEVERSFMPSIRWVAKRSVDHFLQTLTGQLVYRVEVKGVWWIKYFTNCTRTSPSSLHTATSILWLGWLGFSHQAVRRHGAKQGEFMSLVRMGAVTCARLKPRRRMSGNVMTAGPI